MFTNQHSRHCCHILRYALLKKFGKVFSDMELMQKTIIEQKGGCRRGFHTSNILRENVNFYQALGIPKSSTQSEIKSAYYKLSMQYHPDKNQGCKDSAKKFQQITQAYEVLGNYKLRRMYDKGIIHTAGSQYAQHAPTYEEDLVQEVEDDPQTKFYKSRFKKSQVADTEGRTPIYNFDEWSRAHYGTSFERRKQAKQKFDRKKMEKADNVASAQVEYLLFGFVLIAMFGYYIASLQSSYDVPKNKREDQSKKS